MQPSQIPAESRTASPSLEKVLARLYRFHPKSLDLSLGRLHRLLGALGNPEEKLPPVIHVAGTNGKGSTVAFLRAMLEADGRLVHAFTSPHLVHFNERIRLAGSLIGDEMLIDLIEEIEAINGDQPITFFEIAMAVAFLAFARVRADFVLLETGLGGRMDATNVIARPAATIITRISFDHMRLLGNTITAIAGEKAGILKPGVPGVVSYQGDEGALAAIAARAAEIGAPLYRYGQEWWVELQGDGFAYEDAQGRLELPLPALLGEHQLFNAGAAIAALRFGKLSLPDGRGRPGKAGSGEGLPAPEKKPSPDALHASTSPIGERLSTEVIAEGLRTVQWPGRLQRLTRGPLVDLLPAGWELWLDGGHNDSCGEVLAAQAARWSDKPLLLVFGMLTTKDPQAFLRPLAPHVQAVRTVLIEDEPLSLSAEDAAAAARIAGMDVEAADDLTDAITSLPSSRGSSTGSMPGTNMDPANKSRDDDKKVIKPARILICGSLYLAGNVLKNNS